MVRAFIEAMLGEVGRQILYFYEANSLVINLLVLTYGSIMLMCWLTLTRIYRDLVMRIAKDIHLSNKVGKDSTIKQIKHAIKIPWQEVVDAARFPLISTQSGLFPLRKSVGALQKMVTPEDVITHAVAVLNGENPRRITPRYKSPLQKAREKEAGEKRQEKP